MDKYPSTRKTVFVEDLDKEIVIRELTVGYLKTAQADPEYDTPTEALKMCGLSDEDIDSLGMSVLNTLYADIVDLTYPGMRELREQQIAEGTYVAPTDEESEKSKKN